MPEGTCVISSQLLAQQFPELEFVAGVVVAYEPGSDAEWLEHAWNVTADGKIVDTTNRQQTGVEWRYIPVGPKYDVELAKARREFGFSKDPVSFDNDDTKANQKALHKAQVRD